MIVLLSPSKTLEFENKLEGYDLSTPHFNSEAYQLIEELRKFSKEDVKKLMGISNNLTDLNYDRYRDFSSRHTNHNSNAAIKAFKGDVYVGLEVENLGKKDILYANDHVLILSGLYGLLKPLDKMQPYRLEMGTRLATEKGTNLYDYWGSKITRMINKTAKKADTDIIVNLASNEYFKSVKPNQIKGEIINVDFREDRNGELKFISFNAKKARGTMTRFIIQNKITKKEELKAFDLDGYTFSESNSKDNNLLFIK